MTKTEAQKILKEMYENHTYGKLVRAISVLTESGDNSLKSDDDELILSRKDAAELAGDLSLVHLFFYDKEN